MSIALPKGSPIWERHLGEPFAVQSCTVASHFHTLRTIESLTFFTPPLL